MRKRIQSYTEQLKEVFDGNPWLDETFSKKLHLLTGEKAFIQAPGNNHSVAEVVAHITEWRKEVIRRLTDNSAIRMLTEESKENWKQLNELQQTGWQQLYIDLQKSQQQLIALLDNKDDNFLDEQLGETEYKKEYFISGLLHHDLYHLGQIGLILKWAK